MYQSSASDTTIPIGDTSGIIIVSHTCTIMDGISANNGSTPPSTAVNNTRNYAVHSYSASSKFSNGSYLFTSTMLASNNYNTDYNIGVSISSTGTLRVFNSLMGKLSRPATVFVIALK